MRRFVALAGLATLMALTACAPPPSTPGPSAGPTSPGGPGGPTSGPAEVPPPATEPAGDGVEYRVTYNWAVPSTEASIEHPLTAPIPGPIPLPYLVGIYIGDHPEASPKYQRISFYFRQGFPSYRFQYVAAVLNEGPGEPVPLTGNAFLRVGFVDAQAHDENGASTIVAQPMTNIGFANLRSWAFAGDFEGHLTFGLGIQVAADSDQVLPIRSGELKKPDGAGGFFYVVHFDVQNG